MESENAGEGRTGFIAIVGRPSSGKSTLLNTICGQKVSIVSIVPQTTKNRIRGILTRGKDQAVFMDTPGWHDSDKKLNQRLKALAEGALDETDAVLYVLDSTRKPGPEEEAIAALLAPRTAKLLCVVNKVDDPASDPARTEDFVRAQIGPEARLLRTSALKKEGIEELIAAALALLPPGPLYYPEEFYTDQEVEFRVSEIIREKAIRRTFDEIPHCLFVDIEDASFEYGPAGAVPAAEAPLGADAAGSDAAPSPRIPGEGAPSPRVPGEGAPSPRVPGDGDTLRVRASLCVERESQKGMLIGKGASMIKAIRQEAEADLAAIFPYRVLLDLSVKVRKNWKSEDKTIRKLYY